MMHGRILILSAILLAGCTYAPDPPAPPRGEAELTLGQAFDRGMTGTITGHVIWDGEALAAKELVVRSIAYNPRLFERPACFTTPNFPGIDAKTKGVANAVVYLKSIDPRRSRPWDHANVRVEFRDRQLSILQGNVRSNVGFVRKGTSIQIANSDGEYHILRARGAAFFGMPLVDANKTHERTLSTAGIVDLTCGAGYYWLSSHLFIVEHPYYARTDVSGRFTLEGVPAGAYEIVCWLPNWRVVREERDPETADVARWIWAAPVEQTQTGRVEAGQGSEVNFRCNTKMFGGN